MKKIFALVLMAAAIMRLNTPAAAEEAPLAEKKQILLYSSAAAGGAGLIMAGVSYSYYLNGYRAYRAYKRTNVFGDVSRYRNAAIDYERKCVITGAVSAGLIGASAALFVLNLREKPDERVPVDEKTGLMIVPFADMTGGKFNGGSIGAVLVFR